MASELRVNTLKDASGNNSIATSFVAGGSAKAWAKSDFSTTMPDSFNVASLTDTGGGDNSINYTSNMGNANYSVSVMFEASSGNDTNLNCCVKHSSQSTSAVGGQTGNVSGSLFDVTSLYFAVSGDLA